MPQLRVEFNPLWSLTEAEKADLELKKAQLQQTKAQTASVYVSMEAIDPSEVRKKLADSNEFDVETMLDKYGDEELFGAEGPEELDYLSDEAKAKAVKECGAGSGEGVGIEAHNINPGTDGSASTAAPAATKLPQDMSAEELGKAGGVKKPLYKSQNSGIIDTGSLTGDGGKGSGNFGHKGVPGQVGGSALGPSAKGANPPVNRF